MSVTQESFHAALLGATQPVPKGLSDGAGHPAGRRFDVYRNNVAASLTDALEVGFPAVQSLIGHDRFKTVAGQFLRTHPPDTPMLMQYGAAFPAFLEGFQPLAHIGYLADVARLEQAQRQAYHAADAAPLPPDQIATIPPKALGDAIITLAPALQVIQSAWPVHAIWRYATEQGAPKPPAVAQDVLITRPEFDPVLTVLPAGGAAFIAALHSGAPFATALEKASYAAPGFALQTMLAVLLHQNAITDIITTE